MRELNLRNEILSYTDKQLLFQDQDIINIVCKDRIGWLPLKFNSPPGLSKVDKNKLIKAKITTQEEFAEAVDNPVIIHYAGPKPWKTFTYHWYDWWSVYSNSPFYDCEYANIETAKIMNPQYSTKQLIKMLAKRLLMRK